MIAVSVIFDLVEAGFDLILVGVVLNIVVDIAAFVVFAIWFMHNNVKVMSPKNALPTLGTVLGEAVPFVNAMPFWTLWVVKIIRNNNAEVA